MIRLIVFSIVSRDQDHSSHVDTEGIIFGTFVLSKRLLLYELKRVHY